MCEPAKHGKAGREVDPPGNDNWSYETSGTGHVRKDGAEKKNSITGNSDRRRRRRVSARDTRSRDASSSSRRLRARVTRRRRSARHGPSTERGAIIIQYP